jgi:hypothetical protein
MSLTLAHGKLIIWNCIIGILKRTYYHNHDQIKDKPTLHTSEVFKIKGSKTTRAKRIDIFSSMKF